MGYEDAVQTKLLATNCCVCGRPLVDAISVQLGIGPDCRNNYAGGIDAATQKLCNQLTYQAAMAVQVGDLNKVRSIADEVQKLGLDVLADRIRKRFKNVERNCKITITEKNGILYVNSPYKRSMATFQQQWWVIPGRRFVNGQNCVPVASKAKLWEVLKIVYPGEWLKSGKGYFRIPDPEETEN